MGKIYSGSAPLSKVYDVSINAPLDNRTAVRYIADLTTGENGGIAAQVYKGMIVYVQEDDSLYIYTGSSNSTWITSKGKLVNGGDINNWKKVDSFLDPSVNVEYYAEKIGAKIFETEDELTGEIDSPHKGMFALVVGDSNESTIEETGLYILLDDDNTDANNWLRIDPDYSNFVVKDELDDYAKKSEIPDTSDLATKGELNDYIKKGELPDFLTDSDLDGYVKVEDLTDYVKTEDIADLASKSDLDGYVKVEDLVDFLTSSDLDGYATKSYVDKKITDIIGGAPETLDTLKEIAEALEDNATMTQVAEAISTKANTADVYTKTEVDEKIDALPTEGSFPEIDGSEEKEFTPGLATVEGVIDYVADSISQAAPDLTPYAKKEELPTVPTNVSEFTNDAGYLTEHQDLSDYAKNVDLIDFLTASDLDDYVKTEVLEGYLTPEDIADLAAKSDLDGYVKVEDAIEFLTASDLEPYATKSYVDKKITDIIGGAPETLDTLKEIADALQDNATMEMVSQAISTKANTADVYNKTEVYTKGEVDAIVDALPDEGSFPEIDGSEETEFTPGLATVEGVIDYVADSISQAAPDLTPYATKEEIPTKVSELDNDEGYIKEHQDLSDYATKDYVDVAMGSLDIPEHSEVLTTDGTQPTSGSGLSVSDNAENAFVEEVYADDYLHAGVYYASKGIAGSDKNGGSELEGVGHIVLSNGGNSWIKINSRGVMTVLIEDDSLGFNAENIVGLISNDHEYINPYEGHAYPGSRLTFSLGGGDMIKFDVDVNFTGFTEVRDDESEEYIFGDTGSNYEDIDFYSVNVLPTVNAYVDGVSTRVLTEGDKLELTNMIENKPSVQPISNQEILNLFI